MKITIGIASYNQQDYLSEAIESAWHQKRAGEKEIICCNDGSTDDSLAIAKRYPITVIDQVNKGLASARNTILMNATGDFILYLDADDILLENAILEIQKTILEHPEADIIAPSLKTFGTSNEEIILMKDPKLEDFRNGNKIGYCAAIRKSALEEVGGYSPKMVEGYEDLHLTMNLLSRGKKIVTIPEVLWLYRTKEKSMWKDITPEIHKKLIAQINKDVPEARLAF